MVSDQIVNLQNILKEQIISLKKIDEKQFSRSPEPGKWSKKEILGHLIDSAQNNIQRFIRSQYEYEPEIAYNQNEWVRINDYKNAMIEDLINQWVILNKRIIVIMEKMPPENHGRVCRIEDKKYTNEFLFEDYINHMNHHLSQIHTV